MNFRASHTFLLICLLVVLYAADCADELKENQISTSRDDAENELEIREDKLSKITEEVLEDVFEHCHNKLKDRYALEVKLHKKGRVVKTKDRTTDPSLIRMRKTDPFVHQREAYQLPFDAASSELYETFNLTRDEMQRTSTLSMSDGGLGQRNRDVCTEATQPSQCDESARFRTADGQCNNLQNPTYGSAFSCQQRLLPAYYLGNSGIRQAVGGGPLPAPRTLSLNLHYHLNRPTNYVTHMYMFYGQLLDHDIAFTPVTITVENEAIQCCPPEQETHPQCEPILIGQDDPFYSEFGITCLNFVRSAICDTCNLGQRQQMNQVTAFIDASFVYGNSDNQTGSLRANDGTGRMRIQRSNNGDLLPASPNPDEDQCSFPQTNDICFEAGDARANQHTVLTSLQTVFLREHNRLADELRIINPQWDGNRIFQEARRILGAQMQVITYKEYLPITLGRDRMSYFGLWMGETSRYSARENPSLMNEFSTAAFRFGHSLINSVVVDYPRNASNGRRLLRDEFFQPFDVYRGFIGPLIRGASNSPAQWFDQHLVPDVTNFLYRVRGNDTGLDLAAFNINRGRDHGIPPYVEMVRFCSDGSVNIRSFSDLVRYSIMGYEQSEALRRNYRDVSDVDLWPGILMETPNENAVVGPTAACIIGMQFHTLKYGDRFYFEHNNVGVRFTNQQMEELSKTTLSKILCLNTDAPNLPLNAMLFSSRNNPRITCNYVRGVDLSYWRE